jgi:hypothetical protein
VAIVWRERFDPFQLVAMTNTIRKTITTTGTAMAHINQGGIDSRLPDRW